MRKLFVFSTLIVLFAFIARADLPFRNHRYDAFKVLKVTPRNIVFVGNSITNMHEWWEAFDNPLILNRGVSGAVSNEMRANLNAILPGKPAKLFLMIGTNDLGTPGMDNAAHVADNVRKTLNRCRQESPNTQVYVQGILPSRLRNLQLQQETNDSIRRICNEMNITYIDLWDDLISVSQPDNFTHTLDGLHLSASGYRIWCNRIAPYVESNCVYPAEATNNTAGLERSYGMRASYFAMLPIYKHDIVMLGDEAIHGGEWHELMHSPRVKNRGTGWGYPGADIATLKAHLRNVFKGRPDNSMPEQVYLYIGSADVQNNKRLLPEILREYRSMILETQRTTPRSKIYVQALLPTADPLLNVTRVVPFNQMLQKLTKQMRNVTFVDCYTPMVKGKVANPDLFQGNYLNGMGYARISQILAPYMGPEFRPTTDIEARKGYEHFAGKEL